MPGIGDGANGPAGAAAGAGRRRPVVVTVVATYWLLVGAWGVVGGLVTGALVLIVGVSGLSARALLPRLDLSAPLAVLEPLRQLVLTLWLPALVQAALVLWVGWAFLGGRSWARLALGAVAAIHALEAVAAATWLFTQYRDLPLLVEAAGSELEAMRRVLAAEIGMGTLMGLLPQLVTLGILLLPVVRSYFEESTDAARASWQ